MKVGIIVGDPENEDKIEIYKRNWLSNIDSRYVSKRRSPYVILKQNGNIINKVLNKNTKYVDLYVSIYYYLIKKYSNTEYIHFELIYPNEITYDRLMNNDINFYNFYDTISASIVGNKKNISKSERYYQLLKSLPEDKIYPPLKFFDIQSNKCKYYTFLKNKGIPILPFICIDKNKWSKSKKVPEIFTQTFVKPVGGTGGIDTTLYPKHNEEKASSIKRMKKYISSMFLKKYPSLIFQRYDPTFASKTEEVRSIYVGNEYQYSIVSKSVGNGQGQAYGMALLKQDGGTYKYSTSKLNKIKKLGLKVIKEIQIFYGNLPQLNIRVDTGTTKDGKIFLNEIEIVGSFFPSWFKDKSKVTIDVKLAEQMIKIIRKMKSNRLSKINLKVNSKKPNIKEITKNSKTIKNNKTSLYNIYVLGCYKKLCNKKQNLKNRLKLMNYYFNQASIDKNMIKYVGIFWKNDGIRNTVVKEGLYINTYQKMRNGEIGNILSHTLAFKRFLKTSKKWCIILEDDAWVKYDFKEKVNDVIKKMKYKKWDVIWLHNNGWHEYSKNWKNEYKTLNKNFIRRNPTKFVNPIKIKYGRTSIDIYKMNKNFIGSTAAYIINRNGAKYYLQNMFPIGEKPTNVFMQTKNQIQQYSVKGAKRLTNQSWEGDFVWSDTDDSVIQL